jgi:lysophospholipase L1-like esterase
MKKGFYLCTIFLLLMNFSCENIDEEIIQTEDEILIIKNPEDPVEEPKNFKILSLGDSYTLGQSVCETCNFPEQLKDSLLLNFDENTTINLQVIARTGWTTTNLINAISAENVSNNFDLVTLLIGVNNQFQHKAFSTYEAEFPALVSTSIQAAKNHKSNVIIVSIPDYAFTPFGSGNNAISQDLDHYNEFAKNYCENNRITFVNITDITRQGLINPALVAADNLHPSELAYTKFVQRLLPVALEKLEQN